MRKKAFRRYFTIESKCFNAKYFVTINVNNRSNIWMHSISLAHIQSLNDGDEHLCSIWLPLAVFSNCCEFCKTFKISWNISVNWNHCNKIVDKFTSGRSSSSISFYYLLPPPVEMWRVAVSICFYMKTAFHIYN